ncbi:macro domain-containing protein [Chondrinema litorale]|uniref:macro domain-containing protein n=1 Tax=Chondrinema litorale TaxID=2994555 RepID=UPI002543DDC9|nr:macro domain-containing protein [Chondrinema litorale]UZR98219.1 macro domain-containing protein [Chondrinema litorale]
MRTKTLKSFGKRLQSKDFKITLCENNLEIANILANTFINIDGVEVIHGNIFHLWADAVVSPANSFGDMSGGLDKAIDDFYGMKAQSKVQNKIREEYLGELPVGMTITLEMQSLQFPNLMVAPTMRIPEKVTNSLNAYLAMRAIMVELIRINKKQAGKIESIVIPSLCTGVGRMPYQESANQMFTVFKNIMFGGWLDVAHPAMAPYALKAQ